MTSLIEDIGQNERSFMAANALSFDGIDDFVNVPNHSALNPQQITIEAMIYADSWKTYSWQGSIVCHHGWQYINGWKRRGYVLRAGENGRLDFALGNNDNWQYISAFGILNLHQWHHVAATYDGSTMKLYVDGVLVATHNYNGSVLSLNTDIRIGASHYYSNRHWSGKIDEVRIWNHARCSYEINATKGCELSGVAPGLVVYYKFNEGIADGDNYGQTSLMDHSGNNYNGVTYNFSLSGMYSNWVNGASLSDVCATPSPIALCKDLSIVLDDNGQATITPTQITDPLTDYCNLSSQSISQNTFDCDAVGNSIGVELLNLYSSGVMASCWATITVTKDESIPDDWTSTDIGLTGVGNEYSFDPCSAANIEEPNFYITGSGNNATSTITDNVAFTSQTLCGDGTITAKIENVTNSGYGGLMIRESNDAGARQVSIFSNMSFMLRHETRYTLNGPKQVNNFFKPSPIWLRLQRQGNWVFAYYSVNGSAFQYVHAVSVPMQSCVEMGMVSFSFLPGFSSETNFSHVTITGSNGILTDEDTHNFNNNARSREEWSFTNMSIQENNLQLFPNPASDQLTLQFNELDGPATLNMYDQLGRSVLTKLVEPETYTFTLNLTDKHLKSGVYYLDVRFSDQHLVKKVVIAK